MIALKRECLENHQLEFAKHIGLCVSDNGFQVNFIKSSHLNVKIDVDCINIYYGEICEIYRGLALLKDDLSVGDVIDQPRRFEYLAAFCDCSRNAVLHVEMIKKYVLDIVALGFNQLYLYTEDTYEIPEYPYFGHFRGRYSADEIKEADAYARQYGVELIPAIQTLAHLSTIFRWSCFSEIGAWGMLHCGDEKVYEFIDKMFASLRNMYSTDKINIGMDEAHGLGANGMERFLCHMERVSQIAEKYGFKPIVWSDMFFKIATNKFDFKGLEEADFADSVLERIPQNMTLCYWNYSPNTDEYYDSIIKSHLKMGKRLSFAGGYRKWVGFCPNHEFAFKASRTALNSCERNGITDVTITGWGDCGAEGSAYLLLPGLVLYAEKCYSNDMSDEIINRRLSTIFGYSLEEFAALESPNRLPGNELDEKLLGLNSNVVVLWNDPIIGPYDKHIADGVSGYYFDIAQKIKASMEKENRLSYVFETIYHLCVFLSKKAEIGNRLRAAYKSGDKKTLESIKNEIPQTVNALDTFHLTFRKNWQRESKMFGFQVQDVRFGTLRARLLYVEQILQQFLNGEVSKIEELEEDSLFFDCRSEYEEKAMNLNIREWSKVAIVNPLQ